MKLSSIHKYLLCTVSLFFIQSCNYEKFDSSKWLSGESALYDGHRKKMLNDLVENVLIFEQGNHQGNQQKRSH
jgi:hypothetical protein